jgi:hypothetical protein
MSQLKRKVAKQAKRRDKDRKQVLKEQSERSAVQHFLKTIYVWEDLKRAHIDLNGLFQTFPRIKVRRAPGTPLSAKTELMVREIQKALDDAELVFPQGYSFPVNILWSRLFPVLNGLARLTFDGEEDAYLCHRVRTAVAPFISPTIKASFWEAVYKITAQIVFRESRIDGVIYYLERTQVKQTNIRKPVYLLLHQDTARATSVIVDGTPRTAYLVGQQPWFGKDVGCIKWTGAILKSQQEDRVYSVLVQKHVFCRLLDRLGRLFPVGDREARLHFCLWLSLMRPVFHHNERDKQQLLVEFRVSDIRVGYLPAKIVDEYVLIQTFLFLTMDGTPEGTELWRRLRLSRSDKEYLGLDDIETFAATDLRRDAYLVSLLEECNCAHLFDGFMVESPLKIGYAEAMKKHIGLQVRQSSRDDGKTRLGLPTA